jgi:hypothetical protein
LACGQQVGQTHGRVPLFPLYFISVQFL